MIMLFTCGVKQLWCENDHFPSSNTMVSGIGAILSLYMSLLHSAQLVKHSDS
jgi:hypothetical protein